MISLRYVSSSAFAALVLSLVACSGANSGGGAASLTPAAPVMDAATRDAATGGAVRTSDTGLLLRPAGPYTGPTPPVTDGEKLTYSRDVSTVVTTWAGPTAKPSTAPASTSSGTRTDTYSVDTGSGIYDDTIAFDYGGGASETANYVYGFVESGSLTKQIQYAQNGEYKDDSGVTSSDVYNYPQGATWFELPLKTGASWTGPDASQYYEAISDTVTGSSGYIYEGSFNYAATGAYTGQDDFSATPGIGAETTYDEQYDFSNGDPPTYILSLSGMGDNPETWVFGFPKDKKIPVTVSGSAPLPFATGTVKVPDWYPGGSGIPIPAATDKYTVGKTVTTPSTCGKQSGKSATDLQEKYTLFDPIIGAYDVYAGDTYLDSTDTTICLIYTYEVTDYANGNSWESQGSWGGPYSQSVETTTEILTAKKNATGKNARALAAMPIILGGLLETGPRHQSPRLSALLMKHRRR